MAGRGPRPKDPSTRQRRNKPPVSERVIEVDAADQPSLPESMPLGAPWPVETVRWWRMWSESPLAAEFTASDWSELMDTAVLHGAFWSGQISVANELRLRVAKFGATPEDRARLRITFAVADTSEDRAVAAKERRRQRPATDPKRPDPRSVLNLVS